MFDAGRGFFYLVFANPGDCFFTDSYIKLNFPSYLKMRLIEDDFRQLCFIGKASFNDEFDYKMDFVGLLNKELVAHLKKKKSYPWGMKKKYQRIVYGPDAGGEHGRKIHCELDYQTMKEYLLKLLELMDDSHDTAVVCPIEVFAECCESETFLKKMIARQARSNHNVMVLTGSVDASENDRYFQNPKYAFPNSVPPLESEIFFNERLFPNMVGKFDDSSTNTPKLVLTYEALKDAFAERMVVLNNLSFEKLRVAVKYSLMRERDASFRYPPDAYAAILWAWYENKAFREKYPQLRLPDNPFRSMRVVTDFITENGIAPEADMVIQAEITWQYRDFVNRWFREDKGVSIVYDQKAVQLNRTYPILRELETFADTIVGHEAMIGADGMRRLQMMIRHFGKPSYTSVHNKDKLPHERFDEAKNKTAVQELFRHLSKWEWNTWDDGAALLLFTLFDLCYRHSIAVSSMDYYNQLGEVQFEKCLQAIRFCITNSKTSPHENVRASRFINESVNVLRSGDNKRTKDYIILKGGMELYG